MSYHDFFPPPVWVTMMADSSNRKKGNNLDFERNDRALLGISRFSNIYHDSATTRSIVINTILFDVLTVHGDFSVSDVLAPPGQPLWNKKREGEQNRIDEFFFLSSRLSFGRRIDFGIPLVFLGPLLSRYSL